MRHDGVVDLAVFICEFYYLVFGHISECFKAFPPKFTAGLTSLFFHIYCSNLSMFINEKLTNRRFK